MRIIVRMPEPDCFLRYRINAATRNFTSGKSHWWRAATASHGFKMVLFTEPLEDLCQRYMRFTECLSSSVMFLFHLTTKLFISNNVQF